VVIVLMNDKSYGVIKNIQDAQYGGRRCYADLHTPDYDLLCKSLALPHARVSDLADLPARWTKRCRCEARSCWRSTCCRSAASRPLRRPADQHGHADSRARHGQWSERSQDDRHHTHRIIGCGAIGTAVLELLRDDPGLRVTVVVVPAEGMAAARRGWRPAQQ
jgi:hypothetical protein